MAIQSVTSVTSATSSNYSSQASTASAASATTPVSETSGVSANYQSAPSASVTSHASSDSRKSGEDSQTETGTSETIKKAVSDINKQMSNSSVQFGIHEATNRVMIKVVDKETKKVVKEYPAEETLDIIAKAWELAGIMVDKKL